MNQINYTPRQEDARMTALLEGLVDQGLVRGLLALQFTHGLTIDPSVKYDVAAVAALRLLDGLRGCDVNDVIDGLERRAITLAAKEEA